jgi:hypothetical protein
MCLLPSHGRGLLVLMCPMIVLLVALLVNFPLPPVLFSSLILPDNSLFASDCEI